MNARTVVIGEKEFTVRREGTTAQGATAKVKGNEIIIRVPVHWPREEGFRTFLSLEKKIIKSITRKPQRFGTAKIAFTDGQEVMLLGKTFRIAARQGTARHSSARLAGEAVEVTLATGLDERSRAKHVSNLARRVISRALHPAVAERVRILNEKHFSAPVKRVFLKETSSCWGSCSENANINLHFALLFAPPEVMDYVIIHELAHLKENNHGEAFWRLVGTAMPDYAERRKWLKENAGRLGSVEKGGQTGETTPDPGKLETEKNDLPQPEAAAKDGDKATCQELS